MDLVIELPSRAEQMAFNRRRWREVIEDKDLATYAGRIETNEFGNVVMMPLHTRKHSIIVSKIQFELRDRIGGHPLPECPVSTMAGVRGADVGWFSEERLAEAEDPLLFEIAPEICVEVLSPSNSAREMKVKRQLYFEAGAEEVWICGENGEMAFYSPEGILEGSAVCPGFPMKV